MKENHDIHSHLVLGREEKSDMEYKFLDDCIGEQSHDRCSCSYIYKI